jgi:superfamily II DNA or RNA helicase
MIKTGLPVMDRLGHYKLRKRKPPEVLAADKKKAKDAGKDPKYVRKTIDVDSSVISVDGSTAYFLPGIWPRVKKWLTKQKVPYEVFDKRNPGIRPEPTWNALVEAGVVLRPGQAEAICAMVTSDTGVIKCPTAFGKTMTIGFLCLLYPTLNILVLTTSVSVARTITKHLTKTCPGQVGMVGGGKQDTSGKRIIVSTIQSLQHVDVDMVHLCFVDECHTVNDGKYGEAVATVRFARRFGLSATPTRNDGSQLFMESLVGPVIYEMTYAEAVEVGNVNDMRYCMIPVDNCPQFALQPTLNDVVRDRFQYYRNQFRNKTIARVVREVRRRLGEDMQILVMVATIEHLIDLHQYEGMRDFVPVHYGAADLPALKSKFKNSWHKDIPWYKYDKKPKDNEIAQAAFAKGTLKRVICTKSWKAGVDLVGLSIVIRCDHTISQQDAVQIAGRGARIRPDKAPVSFIVDFEDKWSPEAIWRSNVRKSRYIEQGWQEVAEGELYDTLDLVRKYKEEHGTISMEPT